MTVDRLVHNFWIWINSWILDDTIKQHTFKTFNLLYIFKRKTYAFIININWDTLYSRKVELL